MGNSYLNRGIICVLVGICFILAAVFTESALDGLLWGLAGGALGPGIGMIIMHFYWSLPQNAERFKEKQEQKEIEVHDELNEKLRDKSGRIAYLIGLSVITDEGEELGMLKDVLQTGANDVYVVERKNGKEVLLPAIKQCILDVNLDEQKMTVHVLDGLLDL